MKKFLILLIFFFLSGCAFTQRNKDIESSKYIVNKAMDCYKNQNKLCASRYWDLQASLVEHRGIGRVNDFRLTGVTHNKSEVEVKVHVVHSGGVTGQYSSAYLFKLRKSGSDWKIFSVLPIGF